MAYVLEIFYYATIIAVISVYTLSLALLFRNPQNPPRTAINQRVPSISLVIPTYNEASIIYRKLENVLQLEYPRERLEILVVDSASSDETANIVKSFAADHHGDLNLVLIEQPLRRGKSEAVNEALRNVQSDILVMTDADVTFPPLSLWKLIGHFDNSTVGAVSGVEVPVGNGSFLEGVEADYRRAYTAIRMAEALTDTPFMCESELSAYKREILEPLRPGTVCDDVELTVMTRSKGLKAVYATDVPFFETEAGNLKPKLQHKLRRGMNNQHALLHNSQVLFNRSLGKYGTIIFPFEYFVHIVSPILITASLILFLAMTIFSPVAAAIAFVTTGLLSLPSLAIVRLMIRRHRGTEIARLQGSGYGVLGAVAFLGFQLVLLVGLVKLGLRGPQLNWQQISGTRVPIAVKASI